MLRVRMGDRVFSLGLAIVILCVCMSLWYPANFPTMPNFSQILLNLAIDTIVSIGMMILMISGKFDLSVGSVVAFSGGLTGYLLYYNHFSVIPAVLVGFIGAIAIGFVNGILIAKAAINPMIQTLAMMGIVRGMALLISGAGIQNFPYSFLYIGQSRMLGIQSPVWVMAVAVILFSVLAHRSTFFRKFYFIGGNEKAARLSGINVKRTTVIGFIISSGLAGIAGILLASRLGASLATSGRGLELRVITAVILGGASLAGGSGKILGGFLGVLFMALINNLLVLARVSGYWQEIILGIILIAAVGIDQFILQKQNK